MNYIKGCSRFNFPEHLFYGNIYLCKLFTIELIYDIIYLVRARNPIDYIGGLKMSNRNNKDNVPLMRNVGTIEFRGILNGTIPVCHEFGNFKNGLAIVKKNSKYGVVNTIPELVIPIEFDEAEILNNGMILANKFGEYFIYNAKGELLNKKPFIWKTRAKNFSRKIN